MSHRPPGLWPHRDLRLVLAGGLINDTGDWLLMVAMPVYVLTTTGSGVATALLFIAQLAPAALLGPFAGNLVDRWDLRRVVVWTNLAQAITLLPLLAVTADRTWPAFAVTFVQSVLTRFNNPANSALIVRVVSTDRLAQANAARATAENVARLIGSPLGGILVAVGGLQLVVVVDGVSFLAVAAATAAVRGDTRPLRRDPMAHHSTAGTRAGVHVLRRTRPLPALLGTMTLAQVAQGMFVVLFVAFVVRRLGGDGADVGVIRGAQALGGIVGGVLLARTAARVAPAILIGVGFGGMAAWGFASWNLPAVTTATVVYAVLMALVGPFAVGATVGITTAVQRSTPPAYLGLYVGTLDASAAAGQAIGAVGAGILLDRVPLTGLLNTQSVIYVVVAASSLALRAAAPASPERPP